MTKRKLISFPGELSWLFGVVGMAIGVSFVSKSCFGYSMIVAPVYLLFRKIGVLSFGTVEYLYQGIMLLVMCMAVRRVRIRYLCSFVTAVIYGFVLDGCMMLVGMLPDGIITLRVIYYVLGEICIAFAVAFVVHTDMAPEVYELFVKELSGRYHLKFGNTKRMYDGVLLLFSIVLSVLLFGVPEIHSFSEWISTVFNGYILEGIGIGTVVAALVNGPLITACDSFLTRRISFGPAAHIGKLLRYE